MQHSRTRIMHFVEAKRSTNFLAQSASKQTLRRVAVGYLCERSRITARNFEIWHRLFIDRQITPARRQPWPHQQFAGRNPQKMGVGESQDFGEGTNSGRRWMGYGGHNNITRVIRLYYSLAIARKRPVSVTPSSIVPQWYHCDVLSMKGLLILSLICTRQREPI